ncbi:MAG: hypothetical protein RMI91_05740 [Gemmatales bacterium]|nr:hypothetical protein [Gemmatales bacterium]MDW7994137.1 hypothetical protein [Gemmatales bacterium]
MWQQPDQTPRWLVPAGSTWRELQPLQLMVAIHEAARRAGEHDPFIRQEVAESVWHLLTHQWPTRRLVTDSELRQQLAAILRQLGRAAWAEHLAVIPLSDFATAELRAKQATPTAGEPTNRSRHALSAHEEIRRRGRASYAQEVLETLVPEPLADLHRLGVVTLHALAHPWQLAAAPVSLLSTSVHSRSRSTYCKSGFESTPWPLWESWSEWLGQAVIFEQPEAELLSCRIGEVPQLVRELALLSRYSDLHVVLHLSAPLSDGDDQERWGLFESELPWFSSDHLATIRQALLEAAVHWIDSAPIHVVWHCTAEDWSPETWAYLRRAWLATDGHVYLAIDASPTLRAKREAVLAVVGLSLTQLVAHWEHAQANDVVHRCCSVLKLVLAALQQWRERLRPALALNAPPFVVERAQVWLYITGLETAAQHWFDEPSQQYSWQRELVGALKDAGRQARHCGAPWCGLATLPPEWIALQPGTSSTQQNRIPPLWQLRQPEDWYLLRQHWLPLADAFDHIVLDCYPTCWRDLTFDEVSQTLHKLTRWLRRAHLRLRSYSPGQPQLF